MAAELKQSCVTTIFQRWNSNKNTAISASKQPCVMGGREEERYMGGGGGSIPILNLADSGGKNWNSKNQSAKSILILITNQNYLTELLQSLLNCAKMNHFNALLPPEPGKSILVLRLELFVSCSVISSLACK